MASMNQQENTIEQLELQLQTEQMTNAGLEHFFIHTNNTATQHDPALPGGTALQRRPSQMSYVLPSAPSIMAQTYADARQRYQQDAMLLRQQGFPLQQQMGTSQFMHRIVPDRAESESFLLQPMDFLRASTDGRSCGVSENMIMSPDIGLKPEAYLARNDASYLASTGTNLSANDIFNTYGPSAPPSMVSASSAADVPVPMTRENSSLGNPSGVSMERIASSRSQGTSEEYASSDLTAPLGPGEPAWKHTEVDLLAIGTNHSPVTAHRHSSSASSNNFLELPTSARMERSDSDASAVSIRSTASQRRAREAAERYLKNGKALIAPKPRSDAETKGGPSNAETKSTPNKKYRRPQHPKVHCDQCDDHPEGFRGDHELRRHINAKHEGIVKKFVCRNPAIVGIHSSLKLLYPLHKCKACRSEKQYGAYYNAAAHLRRTHFRLKPSRGRSKASMDEKRGGKGGGDWPPMAELKAWFEEVRVRADRSASLGAEDEGVDIDVSGMCAENIDNIGLDASVNGLSGMMDYNSFSNGFNMGFGPDFSPSTVLSGSPVNELLTSPLSTISASFGPLSDLGQSPSAYSMMPDLETETYDVDSGHSAF